MKAVINLVKRNVLIFVRDKGAVFFSVLSMLIVLGLMVLFLGDMNSREIVDLLAQFGKERDTAADRENAGYLIQMWTLAGVLLVNAVTVTMTVMGRLIEDETQGRLASFYIAPVRRVQIALGYILAAWLIGIGICLLTLAVAQGYMAAVGRPLLSGMAWLQLTGMIILNTFLYAAIAYLLSFFIHSESAWSGLLTVVGTLVGFVGGVYLPVMMLPEKVADILKYLPVLHGTAMMRGVCVKEAGETAFAGLPEEVLAAYNENMGVTVVMNGRIVPAGTQAVGLFLLSIAVIITAALISKKKNVRDR